MNDIKLYCSKAGHSAYPLDYTGELTVTPNGGIEGTLYVDTDSCFMCGGSTAPKVNEANYTHETEAYVIPEDVGDFIADMETVSYNIDRFMEIVKSDLSALVRNKDMQKYRALLDDLDALQAEAEGLCFKYYSSAVSPSSVYYRQ